MKMYINNTVVTAELGPAVKQCAQKVHANILHTKCQILATNFSSAALPEEKKEDIITSLVGAIASQNVSSPW